MPENPKRLHPALTVFTPIVVFALMVIGLIFMLYLHEFKARDPSVVVDLTGRNKERCQAAADVYVSMVIFTNYDPSTDADPSGFYESGLAIPGCTPDRFMHMAVSSAVKGQVEKMREKYGEPPAPSMDRPK